MTERVRYNQGFAAVPDEFLQDEGTNSYHIAIYAVIAMHANTADRAWPSMNRIAKLVGASRSKVKSSINELVAHGWLTKDQRWNQEAGKYDANIYELARSLQGRAPSTLGVGYEMPGGGVSGTQEPDPLNQTQLNQISRAIARVAEPRQPPALRDELQRYIDEQMRAVQPYENYGRERGQIKTLAARCRRRDAERPEYVADAMMAAFKVLRESGDRFWSTQPFTPSALSSLWERIETAGGKIAAEIDREREWKEWVAQG